MNDGDKREKREAKGPLLRANDRIWVVIDPISEHEETGENVLEMMVAQLPTLLPRGGSWKNLAIFTDPRAAEIEAFGRLTACRAVKVVERARAEGRDAPFDSVEIYGPGEELLYRADLDELSNSGEEGPPFQEGDSTPNLTKDDQRAAE